MERYEGNQTSPESTIERDDGEWCYEKVDGRWQMVLLPKLPLFDSSTYEERERRLENTMKMLRETGEQWKLDDESITHNEGILRDHPKYHDLFLKWAMRYLRMKGFDKSKYSGKIDQDEGNLLQPNGRWSKTWLVNAVANGREWIDENIEMELRISEGFVKIDSDEERQEELGIEPKHEGWCTSDEI